jgi:hypothetical protein
MNHEHCPMIWDGNVRKMGSVVDSDGMVEYRFRGADVVEQLPEQAANEWVGQHVRLSFEGAIHCIETGKRIKKTYGEGLSYDAFLRSPLACPSILRPELSRIHEGLALRDEAWERENHLQPHVVYVSQTSHLKVGVTRASNVPSRWVDQGATGAIVVANTPYRQLAGEMEVALKSVLSDKTNWRAMLKHVELDQSALEEAKDECLDALGEVYEAFFEMSDDVTSLTFPVLRYPEKVKSVKLDKEPTVEGKLAGIKGQYWLFEDGYVWNVRSHAGYRVRIEIN